MSEKLKPCPFCGGEDIDESFSRGYEKGDQSQPIIGAGCNTCGSAGAMVRVPDHNSGYDEAVKMWNKRVNDNIGTTTLELLKMHDERSELETCDGNCDEKPPHTECDECKSIRVLNSVNEMLREAR